jgi:hypothetical protein
VLALALEPRAREAAPAAEAFSKPAAAAIPKPRWVAVSLLGGTAQPVSKLADYQWDIHPHAGWGAQALVGLGGWSVGPRLWRSGTSQSLGLTGTPDPRVSSTSLDLVARTRVARWRRVECVALASGGRLAIRYQPDRLTLDTGAGPVEVSLGAVNSWIAGAGTGAARAGRGRLDGGDGGGATGVRAGHGAPQRHGGDVRARDVR